MSGEGGRVEHNMLDCDWWRDILLLFSLANHSKQSVAPPQTLQYKKSCSVSFLHNSSRISIISDQSWLWTPDFRWRWTLSTSTLLNRRKTKTLVCYFISLLFLFSLFCHSSICVSSPLSSVKHTLLTIKFKLDLILCFIVIWHVALNYI